MAIDPLSLIKRALTRKRQRGFLRDDSGVTAVEFGLLAIPFFSIIAAILETALIFLSGQLLDSAVQDSSRLMRTGQMQNANYTLEKFRTNVCDRLLGLFSCSGLHIEVQTLGSFKDVNIKPPVNPACDKTKGTCPEWTRDESYQPGTGSTVMVVQVYYRWPVMINFGGFNMVNMPDGVRLLGAASVFRTEPFS